MTKFRIQGMASSDYHNFMCGSNEYCIRELWIDAETKEDAYKIACEQNPDLVINTYIESEEEINNHEKMVEKLIAERKRKEQEKAERKAKREQEKAEEMGLSIEDYHEYKRLERNKKKHEAEMQGHYATIKRAEKSIEYEKKVIADYEEKMKKFQKRG